MELNDAIKVVTDDLNGPDNDSEEEFVLLKEEILTKQYGYIFFYQSKRFLETGDSQFMLAGNGPVVFLFKDGSIHYLGSGESVEKTLKNFEIEKGLSED